jgi:hypothetical protein
MSVKFTGPAGLLPEAQKTRDSWERSNLGADSANSGKGLWPRPGGATPAIARRGKIGLLGPDSPAVGLTGSRGLSFSSWQCHHLMEPGAKK